MVPQSKLRWLRYSLEDNPCIDAKDIFAGHLQDLLTKGSLENSFMRWRTNNGRLDSYQADETLAMIQNKRDRVMNLSGEEEEITPNPTTSHNRFLICSTNINALSVEPNWMMRIPPSCYICESGITLEEGIGNQVTIACFHLHLLVNIWIA